MVNSNSFISDTIHQKLLYCCSANPKRAQITHSASLQEEANLGQYQEEAQASTSWLAVPC